MSDTKKQFKGWLYDALPFLGAIGCVCSIAGFALSFFVTNKGSILTFGYAVFAISLSTIAFWEMHHRKGVEGERDRVKAQRDTAMVRLSVYDRKAETFHGVFHALREANTLLFVSHELDDDRCARLFACLSDGLTEMAQFFSELSGHKCYLCIKALVTPSAGVDIEYSNVKFATLVRDKHSQWRTNTNEISYTLAKNTAFSSVWNNEGKRWFYSSDLLKEPHYDNENKMWHEKHHYRTTIVIPIQAPKISVDGRQYYGIKGCLAMDSPDPDAFSEEPTVYLLACLADILYITLMWYRKFTKEARNAKSC
jgi:hypothetical protein